MRAFYILSFFICMALWVSCKHDATEQKESTTSEAPNYQKDTINPPKMESSSQQPASQAGEKSSTPSGEKSEGTGTAQANVNQGHDYTFLTFKMFKINGAFVPGKDPKDQPYKDQYLDLLPDGTFKWYQGKKQLFDGNWGYNHDVRVIDILPNDKNQKPTEWNVIFNDDMVVFTGTKTFNNAGIQLQLIRKDQIE